MKKAYIYLLLAMISWGTLFAACKFVFEGMTVMTAVFLRYAIGVAVLVLIFRKKPRKQVEKKDRKWFLAVGVGAYFLAIWLQFAGTDLCDSSLAALINTMNPIVMILLAIPVLKERPKRREILAILIALAGTAVIIGNVTGSSQMPGVVLSLLSMLAWSVGSVLIRFVCRKYDSIQVTIYGMTIGMICTVPFVIRDFLTGAQTLAAITPQIVFAMLWLGVVCSAGGFLCWSKGLELAPASVCSLFYPVQIVVSGILGVLLRGEVLSSGFLLGSALITAGILFAFTGKHSKKVAAGEDSPQP